eukprot:Skav227970  [mRNA]  locus=scaffold5474:38904:42285:+ [translate_table: standard]
MATFLMPTRPRVEAFTAPTVPRWGQAVVNEIRDFVNDFPANLSRLMAARRIHEFLGKATPKLLFRHDPADIREDERADRALREARQTAGSSPMQEVPSPGGEGGRREARGSPRLFSKGGGQEPRLE